MSESDDYKLVYCDDGQGGNLLDRKGRKKDEKPKLKQVTPSEVILKLRIEKKGRGGKTVTVIDELPNNPKYFKDLLKQLKRYCGSGGTLKAEQIEMQGQQMDKVRDFLNKKGFQVKG
jgi:translation initiation factor 1